MLCIKHKVPYKYIVPEILTFFDKTPSPYIHGMSNYYSITDYYTFLVWKIDEEFFPEFKRLKIMEQKKFKEKLERLMK